MQTSDFIRFLIEADMPVFTLEDAVKILRYNRAYVRLFLHRGMEKGVIGHVERGVYYVKERHNEYEIASHILNPSYISMVSALAYYGLTTQIPRIVYVVSTKRHRVLKNILGFDIEFKKIKSGLFFGYHKESNGNIFIADPEKAIVDIYYFNDVNDLDVHALEKPPRLNINKLVLYAQKSKSKTVVARVAKLLEDYGYHTHAERLSSEHNTE
jgi:predicted transcriptional regulator of viral defense system